MLRYSLDKVPMSGNRLLRSHWRSQRGEVRDWTIRIWHACGRGPWKRMRDCPPRLAFVTVTVMRRQRQDEDNFKLSLKPIYDALKRTGWIYDDSPEWVRRDDKELAGSSPGIHITVQYKGGTDEDSRRDGARSRGAMAPRLRRAGSEGSRGANP